MYNKKEKMIEKNGAIKEISPKKKLASNKPINIKNSAINPPVPGKPILPKSKIKKYDDNIGNFPCNP